MITVKIELDSYRNEWSSGETSRTITAVTSTPSTTMEDLPLSKLIILLFAY